MVVQAGEFQELTESQRIGLALSGGGVRAMAFHAGVLRWLAETQRLERVAHISSVSGGSLLVGLVFKLSDWRWPSSRQYIESILPAIEARLTTASLQWAAVRRLALPWNWRFLFSRANVVAQAIEQLWDVDVRLAHLPQVPDWSINATTAENGRRFRFKREMCGDYELGYAPASDFKVADAMAVSAAFPGGIGPLVIRSSSYRWHRRTAWDASPESTQKVMLPYRRLHLYDGGVYDNLGLESVFDVGKQGFKEGITYLLVSDAGAPFERKRLTPLYNPLRLKRVMDITMEQVRALRLRALMPFLLAAPRRGAYVQIGVHAPVGMERLAKALAAGAKAEPPAALMQQAWLSARDALLAASESTSLARLQPEVFCRISMHGYETAKWSELMMLRRVEC